MSEQQVELSDDCVLLPDGQSLSWDAINAIAADPDACWLVEESGARKIHAFSEEMQRPYSLLATNLAPTLIVGGFTMHRIKRSDPWRDTQAKLRAVAPVRGRVLDTCTGLGYTAIQSSSVARQVITIELDPTVLAIARQNPWSHDLFDNPRVTQIIGDSFAEIEAMQAESFDLIIHDPPSFSLAGELYSGEFYYRLWHALSPGGRLFHYIGNPDSKHASTILRGVVRRLKESDFSRVAEKREAFGVVAFKAR